MEPVSQRLWLVVKSGLPRETTSEHRQQQRASESKMTDRHISKTVCLLLAIGSLYGQHRVISRVKVFIRLFVVQFFDAVG